jgi:hypothetical protein
MKLIHETNPLGTLPVDVLVAAVTICGMTICIMDVITVVHFIQQIQIQNLA